MVGLLTNVTFNTRVHIILC